MKKLSILLLSLALFSGCITLHDPVTEKKHVGNNIMADGSLQPVFKDVIVRYEPNTLGKALELGVGFIPVPGVKLGYEVLMAAIGGGMLAGSRGKKKLGIATDAMIAAIEEDGNGDLKSLIMNNAKVKKVSDFLDKRVQTVVSNDTQGFIAKGLEFLAKLAKNKA